MTAIIRRLPSPVPVPINSLMQSKLNVNMNTTDLVVAPGESGSPGVRARGRWPLWYLSSGEIW